MPLLPITPPPGVRDAGTDLQSAGRWRDASLVRWREGVLQPIRGWRERVGSVTSDPARAAISWQDLGSSRWTAVADHDTLKVLTGAGVVSDITPAGLATGLVDATVNAGYGGGFYGVGTYGTPRATTGVFSEATTWSLDTFGEDLIACSVADGGLYLWDSSVGTGTPAAAISGAPSSCLGALVTEERFLFALGAGGDPRKVQWADQETTTTWTPDATNQAGDVLLQSQGQIMCGIRGRGSALILTDVDAHTATYIGPPYVYSFERVGSACGVVARKAVAATDNGVFWMGSDSFFGFDGQRVAALPCDVHDRVFKDINHSQISKSWAMAFGQLGEVWFFYPSESSLEVDRYVIFDYTQGHWSMGSLARTAGISQGVYPYPQMCGDDGGLYEHEVGFNYDSNAVFAETAPIMAGAGDQILYANSLLTDEETQGQVTVTFKTRYYANGPELVHGPYTPANPTDVRFNGRQIRMRVTGASTDGLWGVGNMRLNIQTGGGR